jgi:hypothetical protein
VRGGDIDAYLAELGTVLRGPRRVKADLLAEARDGLVDATEAYRDQGHDLRGAERAAVRDFGTLDEVAPSYQAELGWAQARRTSLLVLFVFAMQPLVWGFAFPWATGAAPTEHRTVVEDVVENLGGVMILVAFLAALTYQSGMRNPAVRERVTRITGITGLVVAAVFVTLGTLLTVWQARPDGISLLWTVGFLLAPMAVIARSAGRCLAGSP